MKAAVLAVLLAFTGQLASKNHTVNSLSGRYLCRIVNPAAGTGTRVLFAAGSSTADPQLLLTSERSVEVAWSKDDRWFALTHYRDGHFTSVHIYRVWQRADGRSEAEQVYQTPDQLRYNSHWKLKGWDLERGTIRLECRFQDGDLADTGRWHTREYVVPFTAAP